MDSKTRLSILVQSYFIDRSILYLSFRGKDLRLRRSLLLEPSVKFEPCIGQSLSYFGHCITDGQKNMADYLKAGIRVIEAEVAAMQELVGRLERVL